MAERDVRSVAYQMNAAKFRAYRGLYGLHFSNNEADEQVLQDLQHCEFIHNSQKIVLVSGPNRESVSGDDSGAQTIQHHQLRLRFVSTL
ncbi:ATP-binding protein [Shewanella zhangzhouensis]|uniref:ATP-binding protein n=1 Tax=Shewanella zhangzhouensis TaxID=2864213 RepID=UPI002574A564|nr:ATP-binding protein [Shewanella zhangzhouensis]